MMNMTDGLQERLNRARKSSDSSFLVEVGIELAESDCQVEAEHCFRRAVELGKDRAWFGIGNTLAAQSRFAEAVTAYERAIAAGETSAWFNIGVASEELGDLAGAMDAYAQAWLNGEADGAVQWAFMLREQGEREDAEIIMARPAAQGSAYAAAVLACWQFCRTLDPGLEDALRDGAEIFPAARGDLADLLRDSGRKDEALAVLQRGAKLGEKESFVPLGNFYRDVLDDEEAARDAYLAGIEAGDISSHHNLGDLLEDQGDLAEAIVHYRLAADDGDQLAAKALHRLDDDR